MVPWSTYTGTNLETADTAKEDLQLIGISSARRDGDISTVDLHVNEPKAVQVIASTFLCPEVGLRCIDRGRLRGKEKGWTTDLWSDNYLRCCDVVAGPSGPDST
jgi:hypothetical protein